ncbi:MAG: sigma-70 family RNA polymerase sigma factor [Betaproteobacteria bacterium]|nr:sigma-70 family RNA polymerase sigma factor [Betaproteobacteria bacterium]
MPTNEEFQQWMDAVACHGDKQAFAALFKYFAPRIKGFLMRSGSDAALAEELAQETMVAVWRKAASFNAEHAGVSTWIFTIARNLRISHFRRLPASNSLDEPGMWSADEQAADAPDAPDERMFIEQREHSVRQALAALPSAQAQILRLSFFDGQAHPKIAQELGIPLGTVKSRIRLAVNQLRRALDEFNPKS